MRDNWILNSIAHHLLLIIKKFLRYEFQSIRRMGVWRYNITKGTYFKKFDVGNESIIFRISCNHKKCEIGETKDYRYFISALRRHLGCVIELIHNKTSQNFILLFLKK